MPGSFSKPEAVIRFNPGKAVKTDLFRGTSLFIGLNCFEPGQVQADHTHPGADKFYYVISGRARIRVGEESEIVEGGTLVWAPADVEHGVSEVWEQTVILVGIAPPPQTTSTPS